MSDELNASTGSEPVSEDHYECIYENENPNMYAQYDQRDGGGYRLDYVWWLEERLQRAEAQNERNNHE